MPGIDAINNIRSTINPTQNQQKKEKTEKAATVVGSTGFVATATKYASKQGLKAEAGEKVLQTMMERSQQAARITSKGIKESTGFIAKFKKNMKIFSGDFMGFASKLKNNKILGPIVKSPVTKKLASGFGGVMAFFVLVTGISKAAENGSLAINDFKDKYRQMRY